MKSKLVLLVVSLALLAPACWAAFTLEQVMSSPFPSDLVAAKNTDRVAWVFNAKGVRNVWVADAPDFKARQVTHYDADDGQAIASLRITPDGEYVVYARGSEENDAGEVANPANFVHPPKQQVWAADVETGQARLLGEMACHEEGCEDIELSPDGHYAVWPAENHQLWIAAVAGPMATDATARQLTFVRGDNASPRWSPDGKHIAFISDRGDHALLAIYDFGGTVIRYPAPTVDREEYPRWSADGKQIAFITRPGHERNLPLIPQRVVPWGIWVVNSEGAGEPRQIWHSGQRPDDSLPPGYFEHRAFHFVGDRILFSSEQDGRNHLYSISVGGGAPKLLTAGDFDVEDVTVAPDKQNIVFTSNQDDVDRRHIWRVPLDGSRPQAAVTKGETIEWAPVETPGGSMVCLGSSATTPAMPYRVTRSGREMIAAQALPANFPSSQLVVPKQVIFQSADGLKIHGQLLVPHGRTGPGPALVWTHGGPIRQMLLGFHYMNYYHDSYALNQYLASRGYVVLSINYRLGIMYGRAFREPAHAGWRGASEYQDVVAGAKYLQSLRIVDPHRIGLWGGSYGGYLTAMGLARNSDIFSAGVDFHGVHDWSAFLTRWEVWEGGTVQGAPDLEAARKLAFNSSPVASISSWKSPVLLIQGDDDRNVPFDQTADLAQRLREEHVPFQVLVLPDEIHDFLRWSSWMRAYQATSDFFDQQLKQGAAGTARARPGAAGGERDRGRNQK